MTQFGVPYEIALILLVPVLISFAKGFNNLNSSHQLGFVGGVKPKIFVELYTKRTLTSGLRFHVHFHINLSHCQIFRHATWLSVGLAARRAGSATNHLGGEWALASAPEDFVLVRPHSSTRDIVLPILSVLLTKLSENLWIPLLCRHFIGAYERSTAAMI